MTATRLSTALGDRYALERELGRGGMAIVFLARDLRHDRLVALKTLRPELVPALGPDRFLREIQIAARLQHPNILPLHDSGEADGLLYYVMPYVDGESLRARLERERQLPIDDALDIACQVAVALAYAHSHEVVHRDIKPENILLSGDHALVADFGIARAITAAGGERLTETGLAIGTVAYMSPEQAAADTRIDGRSDIYSLGCVLYEMLVGEPPFTGPSAQAVIARKLSEFPRSLLTVRESLPAAVERAVLKTLARSPADRYATASQFAAALSNGMDAARSDAAGLAAREPGARWPASRKKLFGAIAVLFAFVFAAALALPRWSRSPPATLDPKVVAVVPFRVTGADSSLGYLREGMLDLLATKLSGTRDLRTVDPRTLLRAWRRAGGSDGFDVDHAGAASLAREVGAGRLLEGEIVGTTKRVVLNARLSNAGGASEVRASVEGPSDSLTSLVDRLAAQLLASGAGEEQYRLASLTTTSLPALRTYLDGRAAHRRGDFAAARDHFDRAIELDSSFALAGIGRTMAALRVGEDTDGPGSLLAWRHRDRLPGRDLLVLQFLLGRRYPEIPNSAKENIEDAEAVVEASPDNPEAWAILGDWTYHFGALVGMADARERAIRAYRRALALDSTYVPSLEHLHEIYFAAGDTAAARQAVSLRLRLDSVTPLAAGARWFARQFLADTVLGAISLNDDSLLARPFEVTRLALEFGAGFAAAESVLTHAGARASTGTERRQLRDFAAKFYLNRGQPSRAQAVWGNPATPGERAGTILTALYADADSAAAARIAARVPRAFTRAIRQADEGVIWEQYAVAQYDLIHGKAKAAREAVLAWGGSGNSTPTYHAILLDAQLAVGDHRPDALTRLLELDSLLQAAPRWGGLEHWGNLVAARLWHQRGDVVRALATIRRRAVAGLPGVRSTFATSLRDEGRYAALAGDRGGAIKAYRHYLALRSDAEPAVGPKVEEVRAELAAIERESADR